MRGSAIALVVSALCASGAMAQGALTTAGSLSPVGVQAGNDALQAVDFRLARSVRFRIESVQGLASHSGRPTLLDPYGHRRRLASTFDFYPVAESGFHFSIGMRKRPNFSRIGSMSAISSDLRARLDAPATGQTLRANDGVKRQLPTMTIGWTEALGDRSIFRVDGGAMAIRAIRNKAFGLADISGLQSRIGAVAKVSFIRKF